MDYDLLPEITIKVDKLTQKRAKELGQMIKDGGFKTGLIIYKKIYKYAAEEIYAAVGVNFDLEFIILRGPDGEEMKFSEHPLPV